MEEAPYDIAAIRARARGRAPEIVREVEATWHTFYTGKHADHEVALWVASPFGVQRVTFITANGTDIVMLNVESSDPGREDTYGDLLYLPVEQCSFMLQHYKPKSPQEKRIVVGFGKDDD
jgi:hypothetical protein